MNDFTLPDDATLGIAISVENLFWSRSNKLTAVQTYRHRFIWDATSGELLEKKAFSEATDKCAGPRGGAFHPKFNEVFVPTQAFSADNTLCKINFDTNTSEVFTLTEGPCRREATAQWGMSCELRFGVPSIVHNISTCTSFVDGVRTNIYSGGDSCGRSVLLGAILGACFGQDKAKTIPESWLDQLTDKETLLEQLSFLKVSSQTRRFPFPTICVER